MDIEILIGILGTIVTLVLFYSDIQKKLKYLIERDSGTLTYPQAKDLADLYLEAIQRELHLSISDFLNSKYENCILNNDVETIKRFINHTTTESIIKTRSKMSNFLIIGGQSYKEFIEKISPIDVGIIATAKEEALRILLSATSISDIDKIKSGILNCAEDAGRKSSSVFKEELSRRYLGKNKNA